jgi:uncharacterized lipoprotein YddW (UPF0748 family)
MIRLFVLLFFLSCFEWTLCQEISQPEFRGVWITTVNNIDWPSKPGLTVEQQKEELIGLIDRIERFNLNAVFFQVRAAADAFYASDTEPWSYFLTGKQGRPTIPFFDPLAFATELCHSRGIEIYAWFNPFRVRNLGYYELAKNSFAAKNPQFIHEYDKKRFFDPGIPQVRDHIINVIMEVIRKYKVDGIILDDYFYPYPVRGKNFTDGETFAKYGKNFYPRRLKDWRRNNIDRFISDLHDSINNVKASLRFGISPFGVWRNQSDDPNGSPGKRGATSYDDLYADVYKWLSMDWIDFVVPQLYWEQGNRFADFTLLAKWWNDHSFGKPLYLGQALYKSTEVKNAWTNPKEISDQIGIMRKYENIKGFAFYSASHLSKLSEAETSELIALLTPPKTETTVIPGSSTGVATSGSTIDSAITAELEKSAVIDSSIFDHKITISQIRKDNSLKPPPGILKISKDHKLVTISWHPADSLAEREQKMALLVYKPEKDTCRLNKSFILSQNKSASINKKSEFNPRRMIYRCASAGKESKAPSYSKLFKIKGRRIVYY